MTSPPDDVYEAAARALNIVWGYDQTLDAEDFERAVATDAQRPALRKAVDTGFAAGVAAGPRPGSGRHPGRAHGRSQHNPAAARRGEVTAFRRAAGIAIMAGGEPRG